MTTDFAVSGLKMASAAANLGMVGLSCCEYDSAGAGANGYDCVIIPGARKTTTAMKLGLPSRICGRSQGLVTMSTGMMPKTICCEFEKRRTRIELTPGN